MNQAAAPAPAHAPGQTFNAEAVFRRTVIILYRRFFLFAGIAGVCAAGALAGNFLIFLFLPASWPWPRFGAGELSFASVVLHMYSARLLVELLVYFAAFTVLSAASIYAAHLELHGENAAPRPVLAHALRRAPAVGLVYVLFYAAVSAGLVLAVIPGLIFYTMFYVAAPAAAADKTGPFASLARSAALTSGRRMTILMFALLPALTALMMNYMVDFLIELWVPLTPDWAADIEYGVFYLSKWIEAVSDPENWTGFGLVLGAADLAVYCALITAPAVLSAVLSAAVHDELRFTANRAVPA